MNSTIIKLKFLAICFFISGSILAQEKLTKVSQSIKVNKDVTIDLHTSHCNIVFDTWNKDVVEIEAYIEGEKLSNEELQDALKAWNVDIDASVDKVSIKTKGGSPNVWVVKSSHAGDDEDVEVILNELKYELADLPDVDFDFHFEVPEPPIAPDFSEMPKMPKLPDLPKLPDGVYSFKFDYDAYKKDGEKYLEEYTKQFESKYGKEFQEKMKAWGEKFGKEWEEKYGKQMEVWAKKFEGKFDNEEFAKNMEEWGKRFAEQMKGQAARIEVQVERMAQQKERALAQKERIEAHKEHIKERAKLIEEREERIEKIIHGKAGANVKKTIKIKMPKKAKLKVNVRHGEIELASTVDNIKADLSYAKFKAQSINGSLTSINASYSPVYVSNWNLGELNLNYVKKADLENVKHLVLNVVSSDVDIDNLMGSAIIDGNIGDLAILNIGDDFTNLNVILQNSNAVLKLPKVDCNVQYKGTRSRFTHPKKTSKDQDSNFSFGSMASGKSIVVNAKYSNVVMQ